MLRLIDFSNLLVKKKIREDVMQKNIGAKDKNIRLTVGAALIVIGLFSSFWLSLIGVIAVGTALVGFCPAYLPLKINTTEKK